jgi:hypothetical protein
MNTITKYDTILTQENRTDNSIINEEDFSPPVKMFIENDGRVTYTPVRFERKLIQYDITMSQNVYSDGRIGDAYFVIKTDNSKNKIKTRWEILDIRSKK